MTLSRVGTALIAAALVACAGDAAEQPAGAIRMDGSSTVFPIAEAVAEEFQRQYPAMRVTVGFSGTGGGFQRLCAGEVDLANASRPITPEEVEACDAMGVQATGFSVALDGVTVVSHPGSTFVTCLTVTELARIWGPGNPARTWSEVRPTWPAEEIRLYGPGTDSGTFDYFTEAIVGRRGASRVDFQASEDDNVLVQGVAGDRYSLGYMGHAYYRTNRDRLRVLEVDGGAGCVEPGKESIEAGTYAPLTRPLFVYVRSDALERPEISLYMRYLLQEVPEIVPTTGFYPLSAAEYAAERARLNEALGEGG